MKSLTQWYQFRDQMRAEKNLRNQEQNQPKNTKQNDTDWLLSFDVETRWKLVLKCDVPTAYNAVLKKFDENRKNEFVKQFEKLKAKMKQFSWKKEDVSELLGISFKSLKNTYYLSLEK